jgi:hypothetical protein
VEPARARSAAGAAASARPARLAADQKLDAGGAPALEQHACRERIRHDPEIGTPSRGLEIRGGRRRAHAVAGRGLVEARTLLGRAVKIVVVRIAALLRRLAEGFRQRVTVTHVGDAERAARAMEGVGAALVVLRLAEIGQHVLVAPAKVAELPPVVEIRRLAADVDQPVDGAGAAQHLAARRDHLPIVAVRLRLGGVAPVESPVGEQPAVAHRNV